jgi:MoxR-like ATPase
MVSGDGFGFSGSIGPAASPDTVAAGSSSGAGVAPSEIASAIKNRSPQSKSNFLPLPTRQLYDIDIRSEQIVRHVPASDHVVDYAVDLVRATRPKEKDAPPFVRNWLAWGAGPRAAQYLLLGAKARAVLHGRFAVSAGDIRAVASPVLRHRLFTNFNADAEGIDVEQILTKLLETVPEPAYGEPHGPALGKLETAARR